MKTLLEKIQELVDMYNKVDGVEPLSLVPQSQLVELIKEKEEHKKENETNLINVENLFVCVYNDAQVGLFKKINYISEKVEHYKWNAGSVYVGYNSNYIGIKTTHQDWNTNHEWKQPGYKKVIDGETYVANCNMYNGMSFDDMRLIMYQNGDIGPYKLGKATQKELLDVLSYGKSYYSNNSMGKNK